MFLCPIKCHLQEGESSWIVLNITISILKPFNLIDHHFYSIRIS